MVFVFTNFTHSLGNLEHNTFDSWRKFLRPLLTAQFTRMSHGVLFLSAWSGAPELESPGALAKMADSGTGSGGETQEPAF